MVKRVPRTRMTVLCMLAVTLLTLGWVAPVHADDGSNVTISEDLVLEAPDVLDGDVQVVRGDLVVEKGARIEGDALVVAGDCEVSGEIDGNVAVIGGSLELTGVVDGDVLALGPKVDITGEVDGNVVTSGKVRLGPNSVVTGDVTTPGELDRAEGSIVLESDLGGTDAGGLDVEVPFADERPSTLSLVTAGLLAVILPALFAALVAAVAPGTVEHAVGVLGRRGAVSLILGLLAWTALPFLMVILLPLSPLVFGLAMVVAAVGFVGLSSRVGNRLASGSGQAIRSAIGGVVVGLPIVLGLIAGPWLGGTAGQIVFVAALLIWFGVAALSIGVGLLTALDAGGRARKGSPTPVVESAGHTEPADPGGPAGAVGTGAAVVAGDAAKPPPSTASGADMPTEPMTAVGLAAAVPETSRAVDSSHHTDTDTADQVTVSDPGDPTDPVAAADTAAATDAAATSGSAATDPAAPGVGPDAPINVLSSLQPLYAYLLGQAGIDTVGAIASADAADLVALTDQAGVTPVDDATAAGWVSEARALLGI